MRTLDEAKSWYYGNRDLVRLMRRIADAYWAKMPWDEMGKDERFKNTDSIDLTRKADAVLAEFDDLAVFVILSVFEAILRDFVLSDMASEAAQLTHHVLRHAANDAKERIEEVSLYHNVLAIWKKTHPNEVELVSQVRKYRNWVAHGRRPEKKPDAVEPGVALQRLEQFLAIVGWKPPPAALNHVFVEPSPE